MFDLGMSTSLNLNSCESIKNDASYTIIVLAIKISKVSGPNLLNQLNQTFNLEWLWLGVVV